MNKWWEMDSLSHFNLWDETFWLEGLLENTTSIVVDDQMVTYVV